MKKSLNILALIFALVFASCGASKDGKTDSTTLNSKAFGEKIEQSKKHTLIDVRSPEEFAMNHIDGAYNINVNSSDFDTKASALEKDVPVLVYCKSGSRSAKAASALRELGLTVYELDGGILKWQSDGFPIEVDKGSQTDGFTLTSYNEATTSSPLVLVDFHAVWCGPCKMMAPHIETLKNKYKDELKVIKVDTDKSMEVAQHFSISGIPLVKLYKDGKEVYDKTGYHSQEELQKLLNKYL